MTLEIRTKDQIYHINGGWFSGYWHFSFDRYFDPNNTNFGTLRVFNVDTLIPGAVWPMHPHREMEVITYCVDGEFEHADNLGNGGVLYPGDVQHTTIGSGMYHSEINHSQDRPMTFIQVWVIPAERGLTPSVEQRKVNPEDRLNRFLPLVSNRHPDALPIHQDAEAYSATVTPNTALEYALVPDYGAYLYVISGKIRLNGREMSAGDAAKVWRENRLTVEGIERSELFMMVVQV